MDAAGEFAPPAPAPHPSATVLRASIALAEACKARDTASDEFCVARMATLHAALDVDLITYNRVMTVLATARNGDPNPAVEAAANKYSTALDTLYYSDVEFDYRPAIAAMLAAAKVALARVQAADLDVPRHLLVDSYNTVQMDAVLHATIALAEACKARARAAHNFCVAHMAAFQAALNVDLITYERVMNVLAAALYGDPNPAVEAAAKEYSTAFHTFRFSEVEDYRPAIAAMFAAANVALARVQAAAE